jgi:hypothetical protein
MTQPEIDAIKKSFPSLCDWKDWTPQQKQLERETACCEMIISCLCYSQGKSFYDESTGKWAYYAKDYIRDLGECRVRELWEETVADFKKYATVLANSGCDGEGCTYNSIIWKPKEK